MEWLSEHSSALNLIISLGMFIVWIVYLQVFYMTYRRARKPRLIINRGAGNDIDALCLVSNMSQEPVYVQTVYGTVQTGGDVYTVTIDDREHFQKWAEDNRPTGAVSHGPMGRGEFMCIGSFRNLLEFPARKSNCCPPDGSDLPASIESLEIMIVGSFGGDDLEIAAKRRFRIDSEADPWRVIPVGPDTEQISSAFERRRIRRMIEEELRQA